jgi:hypothetical protein
MKFKELTITFHSEDYRVLHRLINGALRSFLNDHGHMTSVNYHSVGKRIIHNMAGYTRELNKYERKRQLTHRAMMRFE